MKKTLAPLFLLVVLASCLGYKELPVEYDYSYKGNFKKYRTFDIMKPAGVNDSSMMNEVIEKSIISRMKFLGYRQAATKPHLIIGFKMFNDSLKFNGYNQPDIEEWVRNQKEDIEDCVELRSARSSKEAEFVLSIARDFRSFSEAVRCRRFGFFIFTDMLFVRSLPFTSGYVIHEKKFP